MTMPVAEDVLKRSAQDVPRTSRDGVTPTFGDGPLSELSIFAVAQFADEITPWGYLSRLRDVQLREFLPTEPIMASAFATVAARNAAFSWRFDGGDRLVQRAQDTLQYASFGAGWRSFVTRLTLDLIGQDNGAFVEVIREADRATARVVGVANLDAGRCWRTGDPRNPVLYTALKGERHLLPWWRVIAFAEMPSNIERLRGLQYSGATRVLRAAQLFRDIEQFHREKMGGRRPGAIHFVNNVQASAISDALVRAKAAADNQNLYRYLEPIIVEGLKPGEDVSVSTLDLRSLPDGFDMTAFYNQYVDGMAMALLSDRQDFAPLTGGNIGTSTQSAVLAQKTRGKGPGLFMKLIEDAFNFYGLFGNGVRFEFDEQDLTEDREQADVDKIKADTAAVRISSGVTTPTIERQIMVDEGDLDEAYLELLGEEDVTDETTGTDSTAVGAEAEADVAGNVTPPAPMDTAVAPPPRIGGARAGSPAVIRKDPQHQAMDDTEDAAKERFADALASARERVARAVRKAVPAEAKVVTEVKAAIKEQRAEIDATVAAVKDGVESAVLQGAAQQAEAAREAATTQAAATQVLAEAIKDLARPKRRRPVRDARGVIVETVEEAI